MRPAPDPGRLLSPLRVSRAYRDYRLGSIGGGADEVMLMVIARKMGLMDAEA